MSSICLRLKISFSMFRKLTGHVSVASNREEDSNEDGNDDGKEDGNDDGNEDIRTETDASSAQDVGSPIPDLDEVNRVYIFVSILQGCRCFVRSGENEKSGKY